MVKLINKNLKATYQFFFNSSDTTFNKDKSVISIKKAKKLLKNGEYLLLLCECKNRLNIVPECEHTLDLTARLYSYLNDYENALSYYEKLCSLKPIHFRFYQHDIKGLYQCLENLAHQNQDNCTRLTSKAFDRNELQLMLKNGNTLEVLRICKKHLEKKPLCPEVNYIMGHAYYLRNELKKALEHYRLTSIADSDFTYVSEQDEVIMQALLFKTNPTLDR